MTRKSFLFFLLVSFYAASVWAESHSHVTAGYPSDTFIVGIGEVEVSGDRLNDKRRAEILARREIAVQIRVRIEERTLDIMCEEYGRTVFSVPSECRNQIIMIVEETVDEVLEGSWIADTGEDKDRGIFYAVAVMPRRNASSKAKDSLEGAIKEVRGHLDRARVSMDSKTHKEQIQKAKEAFIRGMALEGEREAIEGVRGDAEKMLKELVEEIRNLTPSVGLENSP